MTEDEKPPPGTPVPADEARDAIREPTEADGKASPDATNEPGQALSQFLRFYPCTRFFMVMADRQYDRKTTPREHTVQLLRDRDPWFYWICVLTDYVLIVAAAIGVLTLAGIVIYKSVVL